jgi:hypothetical protein
MTTKKTTLQESAMRYGTAMGIFWTLKFILFPVGMKMPLLLTLFFILTIAVPIIGYRFVKNYRDRECEGTINFPRAFMFTAFMYLFAALFATIIHYVYFRYLDNGMIVNTYLDMLNQLAVSATGELEASINQFREALNIISQLTPLEISLQLISQNIFYCIIIAFPTALLVMRNSKKA